MEFNFQIEVFFGPSIGKFMPTYFCWGREAVGKTNVERRAFNVVKNGLDNRLIGATSVFLRKNSYFKKKVLVFTLKKKCDIIENEFK